MASKTECAVCADRTAVVRIVAADAQGTVLDEVLICAQAACLAQASSLLTIGRPTIPFVGRH